MNATDQESRRLADLRSAFDGSFAGPPPAKPEDRLSLIAIRLGNETLVLRTDQITGVAKCRRITPLASRIPELLGVTGMRGLLVPVFSLAALLGQARNEKCSWLVLAHRESPVTLAFDEFEGQIEIQRTCLCDDAGATPRRHVRQLAQTGSGVRAVIDVPSVVEAIREAAEITRS